MAAGKLPGKKNDCGSCKIIQEKRTKSFAEEMFNIKTYQTELLHPRDSKQICIFNCIFGIEKDTPKAAKIEFFIKDKINGGLTIETNVHRVPGKDKLSPSVIILGQKMHLRRDNFGESMIN